MSAIQNRMKAQLAAGRLAVSLNVSRSRLSDIAPIAAACGFDWLFIDMEHSSLDVDRAGEMCVSALQAGITPIVRVPGHEHFHAARLLDAGAQGIVAPHVDDAETAREVVRNCRLPPLGTRSLTGPNPQLGYRATPVRDAIRLLNEQTLVIVMLETRAAIANADAIAAVEGIDGLLIGSNDLAADLGIPGDFGHEEIVRSYAAVIEAARRHKKYVGMGGIYDHVLMERYVRMGVQFMLGGSDVSFMMQGAQARRSFLSDVEERLQAPAAAAG